MPNIWMVRAGEGGRLIEEFAKGYVAVGWYELGDMSSYSSQKEMRKHYNSCYAHERKGQINLGFSMFYKFHTTIKRGDKVMTYDTKNRNYLIGTIEGDYEYKPKKVGDYPHIRKVKWEGKVSRDSISATSKNSLGAIGTLFSVNDEVWAEIQAALAGKTLEKDSGDKDEVRREVKENAHEFIKDKLLELDSDEMEELVAALLRGMGYRTRITPKGPDRGVDIMASPDGLGLEEPRIKAEVKHRSSSTIGANNIRSFIGGLREGDRALYISTGGFTKDAKYEADRSNIPLTLLDLDDLASLIVTHYENFDLEGRALIPLVRVYWPAE